jgi:glycosyltransferase involved in cell wall biosynthesis
MATVAIIHGGDLLEDWLDSLGLTFEDFRDNFMGSWVFGYFQALRTAGVDGMLICVSARVAQPLETVHAPTGTVLLVLPVPPLYWLLRRPARRRDDASGLRVTAARGRLLHALLAAAGSYRSHVATPVRRLRAELARHGCTSLLCQDYEGVRFDACALGIRSIPVFGTFQGGPLRSPFWLRPLRPAAARASAGLIVSAQAEADRVAHQYGVGTVPVFRIPDPVDTHFWRNDGGAATRTALGIPAAATVAAWHGAVEIRYKGLDVLLDAWDRVLEARRGAPLHLLLVGTGTDAPRLRKLLDGRTDITWVDEWVLDRDRMRRLLSAADVYAFPSRMDAFPISPLEAMACGLPVAATDVRGMEDMLFGGRAPAGLLVPRDDAPAFAGALGRLLDDAALRLKLGAAARDRVEDEFSMEAIGHRLAEVLAPGTAR